MDRLKYHEKARGLRRITGKHFADEIYEGSQIAIKIFEHRPEGLDNYTTCTYDNFVWALGHIFQAGKIEGIRKERAIRKAKLSEPKQETDTGYAVSYEQRTDLIGKFYDIEHSLSQIAGITNSVGDALYSGNDSIYYAPALSLASSELKRQQKEIEKLTNFILKDISRKN